MILKQRKNKFVLEENGIVWMISRDPQICRKFAEEFKNERNDPRQKSVPNKQTSDGVGFDRPDGGGNSRNNRRSRKNVRS